MRRDILRGDHNIARFLARKDSSKGLYGASGDALRETEVRIWKLSDKGFKNNELKRVCSLQYALR